MLSFVGIGFQIGIQIMVLVFSKVKSLVPSAVNPRLVLMRSMSFAIPETRLSID